MQNILLKIVMISKNKSKYIRSLEQKKTRNLEKVFVAEGPKVVGDLVAAGLSPDIIVCTEDWKNHNPHICSISKELIDVTEEELRKVSFLLHPQKVIGVFNTPLHTNIPDATWFENNLCIMLDGVQDPGNMGTIIRIADWFGIDTILCSKDTVDAFSPKVVQATMGSIARVKIIYTDIIELVSSLPHSIPVYGTLLDGNDIYQSDIQNNGIIVMGNEGNGISQSVRNLVTHKLLIPSFPPERPTAESLNVAIATAIVCSEFRRRK